MPCCLIPQKAAATRWVLLIVAVTAGLGLPGALAAAAGPTAAATPSTRLVDGQRVVLHASGFPAYRELQVLECQGTEKALPRDNTSCEGLTLDSTGYTDGKGDYVNEPGDPSHRTAGYRVYTLPSARFPIASINCGPASPCVLYVGLQETDFSQPHTFVPLSFLGARTSSSKRGSSATGWIVVVVIAGVLLGAALVFRGRRLRAGAPSEPPQRAFR